MGIIGKVETAQHFPVCCLSCIFEASDRNRTKQIIILVPTQKDSFITVDLVVASIVRVAVNFDFSLFNSLKVSRFFMRYFTVHD